MSTQHRFSCICPDHITGLEAPQQPCVILCRPGALFSKNWGNLPWLNSFSFPTDLSQAVLRIWGGANFTSKYFFSSHTSWCVVDYFLDVVFSEMTDEVQIAVSKLCRQQGLWDARAGRELQCPFSPSAGLCARIRVASDELLFVSTGHMGSDERIFFGGSLCLFSFCCERMQGKKTCL